MRGSADACACVDPYAPCLPRVSDSHEQPVTSHAWQQSQITSRFCYEIRRDCLYGCIRNAGNARNKARHSLGAIVLDFKTCWRAHGLNESGVWVTTEPDARQRLELNMPTMPLRKGDGGIDRILFTRNAAGCWHPCGRADNIGPKWHTKVSQRWSAEAFQDLTTNSPSGPWANMFRWVPWVW